MNKRVASFTNFKIFKRNLKRKIKIFYNVDVPLKGSRPFHPILFDLTPRRRVDNGNAP